MAAAFVDDSVGKSKLRRRRRLGLDHASPHLSPFSPSRVFDPPRHPGLSHFSLICRAYLPVQRPHASAQILNLHPAPARTTPSSRVSGVTQSIRQKLNFVDEGKWKKFSARRLELIDKMALSTKKASEQDDVIIAVADTLREENGFPPDTLQDFDKLVRAAVQSVRRNRKRLPKSKSRSKSLSVERDMSSESSSSHMGMIDHSSAIPIYESRMATDPWPVSSSASLSPSIDVLAASTSSSVSDASSSYMSSYHPSHLGRLSDPSVGSVRPTLARSPTASSMSSVSTFSSYLSASNEDTESTGSQTSLDVYTASSSSSVSSQSSTLSSLPRTLPSPGITTSLISKSVSTALPDPANDRDQSIALELLYANVLYPCLISRSQMAASSSNCLPFLLNIVRRALGLADNSLVALYYTRKADGVRYQIASDAEAELLLRTRLGMDSLRIEVLAMALSQSSVVNHQTSTSVSLLSPSGSTLSPVSDTNEPRTRRISIGALVVA
ncbi:transcription factor Vhr1-domain-containing protein [Myxozyma melibiosi]|uniref:Transcription factor Vhr1-domain-containing protein n=1 Tax=Myxozyma melibiosi TaxID=54550 RepID=A0ABR1FDS9_9ASCO